MTALYWLIVECHFFIVMTVLSSRQCRDSELRNNTESVWQNFTIDCNPNANSDCLTLNQIAKIVPEDSHVYLKINISRLQLTGRVEFRRQESLTITGESTVISCTERDSGLAFVNIDKVTIAMLW